MKDLSLHPCFNEEMRHKQARIHLPVAPNCNIQCNYCNRKYDCCNESRPGVTSSVLEPLQAFNYFIDLKQRLDNLSVVGIAGPGDPFANPEETLSTIELISSEYPEMLLCLSSNGLNLAPYIDRITKLNVSHVTVTINSLNPETLTKIYSWVRDGNMIYKGLDAAKLLLSRQLDAIVKLKEKGMIVKVNTVVIPGVNDNDIEALAKKVSELGADTMNCIPLYPTAGTPFENFQEPSKEMMVRIKTQISKYIKPMNHCARCRADAAGLLGHDLKESTALLNEYASRPGHDTSERPYVAVATGDGLLVNLHLGEADSLYIYEQSPKGYKFIEQRLTPPNGTGDQRWVNLARTLRDCRAVLVSALGDNPRVILESCSIHVVQMTGLIDDGLEGIYEHRPIRSITRQEAMGCHGKCSSSCEGCA